MWCSRNMVADMDPRIWAINTLQTHLHMQHTYLGNTWHHLEVIEYSSIGSAFLFSKKLLTTFAFIPKSSNCSNLHTEHFVLLNVRKQFLNILTISQAVIWTNFLIVCHSLSHVCSPHHFFPFLQGIYPFFG